MDAEDIIATVLSSDIYIGLSLPNAVTRILLRSYKMFNVLLIVSINKRVGLQGILNFHLLRDAFPYRLA
jgi:hypothetical protein